MFHLTYCSRNFLPFKTLTTFGINKNIWDNNEHAVKISMSVPQVPTLAIPLCSRYKSNGMFICGNRKFSISLMWWSILYHIRLWYDCLPVFTYDNARKRQLPSAFILYNSEGTSRLCLTPCFTKVIRGKLTNLHINSWDFLVIGLKQNLSINFCDIIVTYRLLSQTDWNYHCCLDYYKKLRKLNLIIMQFLHYWHGNINQIQWNTKTHRNQINRWRWNECLKKTQKCGTFTAPKYNLSQQLMTDKKMRHNYSTKIQLESATDDWQKNEVQLQHQNTRVGNS